MLLYWHRPNGRGQSALRVPGLSMSNRLRRYLELLADPQLNASLHGIRFGLEREALRVDAESLPAKTPHPEMLGAPLTHPRITTDFSEALLELVTEPHRSPEAALKQLRDMFAVSCDALAPGEALWAASMPHCPNDERDIALAHYGTSASAQMKTLYRAGLSHRYGCRRQIIAGLHFNFSLPDNFWQRYHALLGEHCPLRELRDDAWFHILRNCHRWSWLLAYLFGASPVMPPSFPRQRGIGLRRLAHDDYGTPGATSLRLSRAGYYSTAQHRHLLARMDRLDSYVNSLRHAIIDPFPAYAAIDRTASGKPQQLSASLLQVENEYYGSARPKCAASQGTPPLCALAQGGVEYLELRCLDLDPGSPLGVDGPQMRFLSSFLLYCLAADGSRHSMRRDQRNLERTARGGRRRGLSLEDGTRRVSLRDWGLRILDDIELCARQLDTAHGGDAHQHSCAQQRRKLEAPEHTPAALLLRDMEEAGTNFVTLIAGRSAHWCHTLAAALTPQLRRRYHALAQDSKKQLRHLESTPFAGGLEAYLQQYFEQYRQLDLSQSR